MHNHHNFAWRERTASVTCWVVRKGATPAFPGQRGFVGGSMGDNAVILEGVESEDGAESLYSTVHGAGRVMSRTQAKGKKGRPGLIDFRSVQAELRERGIELRGGDADEAPGAYKRLDEVLADHGDSIRVLHRLRRSGSRWRAPDTFDPYKD